MKVLITSGGTEEPIDGVRSISNFSTGQTGVIIADYFFNKDAEIVLLKGKRSALPKNNLRMIEFLSFDDLNKKLIETLKSENFDAIIHLAAVSDYSVDYLESESVRLENVKSKLDSSKPLTIHLKPNFKILNRLQQYVNKDTIIIGFKLTKGADNFQIEQKISNIFINRGVDFVVHNDLTNITKKKTSRLYI